MPSSITDDLEQVERRYDLIGDRRRQSQIELSEMVGRQHHPVIGSDIGRNLGKCGRTACFTLQTLTVGKDLLERLLRRAGLTAFFPDRAGFGPLGIGGRQISPQDALHPVKAQLQDKDAANKDEHQNGPQSDHSFCPFFKISWLSPVAHVKGKMVFKNCKLFLREVLVVF